MPLLRWTSGLPSPVTPPNAPVVTWTGTPTGTATWGYEVAAVMTDGDTQLSSQGSVATGATTATGTAHPVVTKPTSMPAGAIGWRVVRTQSGGTPAGVNVDVSGVLPLSTTTFNDTGLAGSAYTAVTQARPAAPDTRVATVRLANGYSRTFQSGELVDVPTELVATVTLQLTNLYPSGSVTVRGGA